MTPTQISLIGLFLFIAFCVIAAYLGSRGWLIPNPKKEHALELVIFERDPIQPKYQSFRDHVLKLYGAGIIGKDGLLLAYRAMQVPEASNYQVSKNPNIQMLESLNAQMFKNSQSQTFKHPGGLK